MRRFRGWTIFLCFMFLLNGLLIGQAVARAQSEEPSRIVFLRQNGSDTLPYRVVFKKSCWPMNEDQIHRPDLVDYTSERAVFNCPSY